MLENFRRAFSPGPTDCPWVSEDELVPSNETKSTANDMHRIKREAIFALTLGQITFKKPLTIYLQ